MLLEDKFPSIIQLIKYLGVFTGSSSLKSLLVQKFTLPSQFIYACLLNTFVFALQGEILTGVLSGKPGLYPKFFMAFCWGVICWGWLKGFYSLLNKIEINAMTSYWEFNLEPQLWPEIKEEELKKVNKKLSSFAIMTFFGINVPMILAAVFKTFWSKTLFIPSGFSPDYATTDAPFLAVLFQNCSILFFNLTWTGSEIFISLLMNVILSEFKYLQFSLEKLLDKYEKRMIHGVEMRRGLGQWIEYHGNVLKFIDQFKKIFSVVFTGQVLFITIAMCGLLFSTVSGKIPRENTVYCLISICGNMLLKLQLCRNGDAIAEQSSQLRLVCLSSLSTNLPHDVLSSLKVVNQVAQHEIVISMRGLMPLTSDTFRKMVILQYRFYMFMSDTQK